MQHVRWSRRPALHRPVLITAFSGWNDAGDAASSALRFLAEQWDAEPFACVEGDEFYDYTETRPTVRLVEGRTRRIEWPRVELLAADIAGRSESEEVGDAVLVIGPEPQLRWPSFCSQITAVGAELGVRNTLHLGALLAEVPHSRPVPMTGSGADRRALTAQGLEPSRYEGPTGIVGVLHDACDRAGFSTTSLWAAVPTYVSGAPSPKAALALVSYASRLLGVGVDTSLLETATDAYEREIDALVAEDDDTAAYVRRLEMRHDVGDLDEDDEPRAIEAVSLLDVGTDDAATSDEAVRLADEVERFLRDRHGEQ